MKQVEIRQLQRKRLIWTGVFVVYALSISSCSVPQHAAQSGPPPAFQYLGEWGTAGTAPGQLQNPQSLSSDGTGNIYIADDGKPPQVEKFEPTGHPLLVFDMGGNRNSWDIAVDAGNAIFVVDEAVAQVQIFSPEGEVFRTLAFRYRSALNRPSSIAIEPDGEFYLADCSGGRLARMYPRGRILQSWGKPAGLPAKRWTPCQVRLGTDSNLYVADADNQRIEKLSPEASYISSWAFPFSSLGSNRAGPKPCGLAVSRDFVVATDEAKRLLGIWTLNGQPELTVDFAQHPEWGQNASPTDVVFTPKGELLVLDRTNKHVLRFRINIRNTGSSSPIR